MEKHVERTKKFHDKLQSLQARKARHQCMYPRCSAPAIQAHAISKEHSLRGVAEDGFLIHPEPIRADKDLYREIKFNKVDIKKATTFKGFCQEHDAHFSALDKLEINTFSDVFLQLYRSFASMVFEDAAYRESARHAGDIENFNDAFELGKPISSARALALSYDLSEGYSNASENLPNGDRLQLTPFSHTSEMNAKVLIKRINFPHPVALQKIFVLREGDQFFDTFVFVIPSESSSTILIVCNPSYTNLLLGKVRTNIDTLSFIESCMMCDGYWWLAPSVVQKWPKEKLKHIEGDYWNFHERKFLESYDVSIFDDIRIKICKTLPSNQRDIEIAKVSHLPTRKSMNLRRLAFSVKVEQDKKLVREQYPPQHFQ